MTTCADCGKNTNKPRSWEQFQVKNLCPACYRKKLKKFIDFLAKAKP